MSLKKKLGLGMASAALGLSLVGGGTFAYFSDTATVHNGFKSGTLDIGIGSYDQTSWPINFDLQNFRPGDTAERTFDLTNKGSLAIEDTYLNFANASVTDTLNTGGNGNDFLQALNVSYFMDVLNDSGNYVPVSMLLPGKSLTLKDALEGKFDGVINPAYLVTGANGVKLLNLTPDGIDVGEKERFRIMISFTDTNQPQNKLQGMVAKIDYNVDARQVIGNKYLKPQGPNGTITGNGVQGVGQDWNDASKDKYKVDAVEPGLVSPDTTDKPAWEDTNN
jgi:spore coat-associated protein N